MAAEEREARSFYYYQANDVQSSLVLLSGFVSVYFYQQTQTELCIIRF